MIEQFGMEYACARLQGALGRHPSEPAWQRVEAARDLAALLDAARASPFLSAWTAGLSTASGSHAVELRLRARWRALVDEAGSWMPGEWRAACAWIRPLVDLPALLHLYHGGAPHPWMHEDPELRSCLDADLAKRRNAVGSGVLGPLGASWETPATLRRAWIAEWQRRWPRREEPAPIRSLVSAVEDHLAAFSEAAPESAWPARAALRARLKLLLRSAVLHPAVAFAYLAIAALDVERLRAALARCMLFAKVQATPC